MHVNKLNIVTDILNHECMQRNLHIANYLMRPQLALLFWTLKLHFSKSKSGFALESMRGKIRSGQPMCRRE